LSADEPERAASGLTLPIACSLNPAEAAERVDLLRTLATDHLLAASRTTTGLELRFSSQSLAGVSRLVELERVCCPFLRFAVSSADDVVVLIEADEAARSYLDGMYAMALEFLGQN